VDESTKTAHLNIETSSVPNFVGAPDQRRIVTSLTDEELKLTNPRTPAGVTLELVFKRAKWPTCHAIVRVETTTWCCLYRSPVRAVTLALLSSSVVMHDECEGLAMDGRIFNSRGQYVANIRGNVIYNLAGKKLYDLRGQKIYRPTGELVGHLNAANGDRWLDKSTDRLF
jgi:hypothetical protein